MESIYIFRYSDNHFLFDIVNVIFAKSHTDPYFRANF